MGYTHYFKNAKEIAPRTWAKVCDDVRKILALPEVARLVCREYDEPDKAPEITESLIMFNGRGDDGHETAYFPREAFEFKFCKTARKPYDAVVCAVLLTIASRCAGFTVSSDGERGDFSEGLALCERAGVAVNVGRALRKVDETEQGEDAIT